jgi:hypothetical protein
MLAGPKGISSLFVSTTGLTQEKMMAAVRATKNQREGDKRMTPLLNKNVSINNLHPVKNFVKGFFGNVCIFLMNFNGTCQVASLIDPPWESGLTKRGEEDSG